MTTEIERFLADHPEWEWADEPTIRKSAAYAYWAHRQAWRELGTAILDTLPGWYQRLLGRSTAGPGG